MKIHANSFYLDMNAMLNQINSHNVHGFYNKTKANADKHIADIQKKIDDAVKSGKANTQWMVEQINEQIEEYRSANNDMWNHAMPPQVNKAFNLSLISTPRNTDYYYPEGQFPDDPEPGDVCWQSDDWNDVGSNNLNAKMYEYYKEAGWKPVQTKAQITGVNINGASIHGGMISGATFRSGQQGMNGAPFWVNRDGTVYAQNFIADLTHEYTKDGQDVNNCVYDGFHRFNGDNQPWGGFTLNNGLLTERAGVVQKAGTYIWSDHKHANARVVGNTYLEPGYLKLRYIRSDQNDLVRTDLRAGNLEISGNWGQGTGIRMGYWNTTGPHIAIGDWDAHISGADLSLTGGQGNIGIHQPFIAHNGIRTNSLEVNGGFRVNNKTLADQSDINQLNSRIDTNSGNIDSNAGTIRNHGTIINGEGGYEFPENIINGSGNYNSHDSRLNQHDSHLTTHDSKITDLYSQLSNKISFTDTIEGGNINFGSSLNVGQAQIFNDGEIDCSNLFLGGTMVTLSGTRNSLDVDGNLLATFDWCNSKFATRGSRLSIKRDIHDISSKRALAEVLNTDIKAWNYKDESLDSKVHYGPIIDDLDDHSNAKYYTPEEFITNDDKPRINEYDSVAYLFLSIQELEKQNSELSQRVAKLELENKRK